MRVNKSYIDVLLFWCMVLVILTVLFIALGCSPAKKAHKYFENHKQEFAQDCSDAFPCAASNKVDSVLTLDTLYLEQEPEIIHDTTTTEGQLTVRTITKKVPVEKVVTKTLTLTRYVIDSAANTAARVRVQKAEQIKSETEKKLTVADRKAGVRLWMFISSCVVNALLLFVMFKKPKKFL